MDMNIYFLIWAGIFGLCLGSFYNVVILRSLSGESIVFPPSKCPKCGHKLYFWHNIPVISYIILRGKCYFCKEKISIQYPVIELLSMALFMFSFIKFGISWTTLFTIIWLSCLLIMTATDLKEKLVDCNIAIGMAVCGIIHALIIGKWLGALYSILGLIAAVLIFIIISKTGKIIAKKDVIGEADTYVAGALGAAFGIFNIFHVLIMGLFAYAVFVVPVFLYNKLKQKDYPTCISALFFGLSAILFLFWKNYFSLAAICLSGIALIFFMFKNIKQRSNELYVPYVPAFAAGALLFIIMYL